jgi:hypothetical protein
LESPDNAYICTMKKLLTALLLAAFAITLKAQATTEITVQPAPKGLHISGPTLICKGSETILKAEGEYESFLWNTGSTDRFLRVREAGVYEVTAKTKGGCTLTTSIRVEVKPCSI